MTKREELARAIDAVLDYEITDHEHREGVMTWNSNEVVDAILDALMEPSEGMIDAAATQPQTKLIAKACWITMLKHVKEEE